MDCQAKNERNEAKVEQIISEFFAKSLQIILESRIPSVSSQTRYDSLNKTLSLSAEPRKRDRWFNLVLGNSFIPRPSVGSGRSHLHGLMVIDILLSQRSGDHLSTGKAYHSSPVTRSSLSSIKAAAWPTAPGRTGLVLLERWFVQFRSKTGVGVPAGRSNRVMTDCTRSSSMPNIAVEGNVSKKPEVITNKTERGTVRGSLLPHLSPHALEVPVVYKQTILMLRSVYSMTRLLPVYRLFRLSSASPRDCSFTLSYRISASPSTDVDDAEMIPFCFTPVDTRWGQMIIKVLHRTGTSVTALEVGNPGSPHIIADYVGSPTTEPMKKLSGEPLAGSVPIDGYLQRRIHVVCLPSSMPNSPPGPAFGWHQWWKGGLENVQQALQPPSPSPSIGGSPLSHSDMDSLQMSFSSQLLDGSLDNKSSQNHGNRTISLPIPIVQNQRPPASPCLHAGGLPLSCDDMNKSPASSSSQLSASAIDSTFDMRSAQYHRKLSFNLTVQHYHQVSSSVAIGGSALLRSNLDYVSSSSQTAVPAMDVAVDMKSEKCHGKLNVSLPIPIVQHHGQQASSSSPVHGYPLPCSNSDNTCTNPSGQITLPNNPGHNENLIIVPIPVSQHACSQASCLRATVKPFSSRGLRHSGSSPVNICTGFTVPSQDAFENQGTSSEQLAPDISVAEAFETTIRMAHVRRPFIADSGEKKGREYEELGDIEDDACPFPFAIDDVEVEQRRIKSIHDCGTAAGELVQKLKSAAPLRQRVRDPVSGNSMYARGSGSPARRVITHSVPQKIKTLSDALEELIAYKEMRDHLLRQSGRK